MSIPTLAGCLPELVMFARQLSNDYQQGRLVSWAQLVEACVRFYTLERMNAIERIAPGWHKMASYTHKLTLVHVTAVLSNLYALPEFLSATPHQQTLIEWIVLWHDIEKEAQPDKRDHTHGFRSAAVAGRGLPALGFELLDSDSRKHADWYSLTHSADVYSDVLKDHIHDNRQLPAIIDGIDQLFGPAAADILKGALLHMSITVVQQWPASAPLTDEEIWRYVTPDLFPLLRTMILADSMAWELFDPITRDVHASEIRAEFRRIGKLISR
jgi:hypothetical protein